MKDNVQSVLIASSGLSSPDHFRSQYSGSSGLCLLATPLSALFSLRPPSRRSEPPSCSSSRLLLRALLPLLSFWSSSGLPRNPSRPQQPCCLLSHLPSFLTPVLHSISHSLTFLSHLFVPLLSLPVSWPLLSCFSALPWLLCGCCVLAICCMASSTRIGSMFNWCNRSPRSRATLQHHRPCRWTSRQLFHA